MYCPKCSQKQISEEMRFCSRCGFQMEGVIQLLANDGIICVEKQTEQSIVRRAASTVGTKIIYASVFVFIITFLFAIADNAPAILIIPFLMFLVGLAQMIYALIFNQKTSANVEPESVKNFNPAETRRNLPPIQSVPVSDYQTSPHEGRKMVKPPSVTESTTKLFKISEVDTNEL